jgi:hypothetical protein
MRGAGPTMSPSIAGVMDFYRVEGERRCMRSPSGQSTRESSSRDIFAFNATAKMCSIWKSHSAINTGASNAR